MGMDIKFGNDWDELLYDEIRKPYFIQLLYFLNDEYQKYRIYPKPEDLFNALKYTSYKDTKVVIIGQDPYHQVNQAHGLCFSVPKGVPIPMSLRNIFQELVDDVGITYPTHGNLTAWALQGVLLLNTIMTVRDSQPLSHANKGWENFTNAIIKLLNEKDQTIVFLLWGKHAQSMAKFITNPRHAILTAPHPSPLSAHYGFLGCRHFSKTNKILMDNNLTPINWQI